ncbi:hypothetical protein [Listeria monocytogenes]|nr:hypothetical protein [Listeria monocytogenes]
MGSDGIKNVRVDERQVHRGRSTKWTDTKKETQIKIVKDADGKKEKEKNA